VDAVAADLRADVTGDHFVALGGGRVIDVAKALAAADGPRTVAAVPTSLSGAEMTGVHRHARGVDDSTPKVRPSLVVNDPALSASQPIDQLAASSANALGHAITALVSERSTAIARAVATEAITALAAGWSGVGFLGLRGSGFDVCVALGTLGAHAGGKQDDRARKQRDQRPAQAADGAHAASRAKNMSITGRAASGPETSSTRCPLSRPSARSKNAQHLDSAATSSRVRASMSGVSRSHTRRPVSVGVRSIRPSLASAPMSARRAVMPSGESVQAIGKSSIGGPWSKSFALYRAP
jgi:hypothetical protein